MKLHTLSPAYGARTKSIRKGRGTGSGWGKTSGKGMKGQNSRSGGGVRPGFEGGQIPLIRRVPIRGFNNYEFDKVYSIVNVGDLDRFEASDVITQELLFENRIIGKIQPYGLKVLGNGDLTKPLVIQAKKFSASAIEKIAKAGGKAEVI